MEPQHPLICHRLDVQYSYSRELWSLSWTVAQSCTVFKVPILTSCTCILNWDRLKRFKSKKSLDYFIKPFLHCLLPLEATDPMIPTSYRACSPRATWAAAAFKHVSHHNLNKHTSFNHTCSQKPPSLWPEGQVARGPRSLAGDNQGHFVLGNIRAVTFSQGVPYP